MSFMHQLTGEKSNPYEVNLIIDWKAMITVSCTLFVAVAGLILQASFVRALGLTSVQLKIYWETSRNVLMRNKSFICCH